MPKANKLRISLILVSSATRGIMGGLATAIRSSLSLPSLVIGTLLSLPANQPKKLRADISFTICPPRLYSSISISVILFFSVHLRLILSNDFDYVAIIINAIRLVIETNVNAFTHGLLALGRLRLHALTQ